MRIASLGARAKGFRSLTRKPHGPKRPRSFQVAKLLREKFGILPETYLQKWWVALCIQALPFEIGVLWMRGRGGISTPWSPASAMRRVSGPMGMLRHVQKPQPKTPGGP